MADGQAGAGHGFPASAGHMENGGVEVVDQDRAVRARVIASRDT